MVVVWKNSTPVRDERSRASYVSILEPGEFHTMLGELGTQVRTLLTSLAELRTPPAERLETVRVPYEALRSPFGVET